jgi:heterodisulfide reductase subunit A-like polyferredoxin
LTQTELLSLEGDPGHFTARLKRQPRYVDLDKCTSCGECVKVCPIQVGDEYNEGLNARKAIFKRYPQAIPGAFAITKRGTAPCRATCPAHVSVQGFIALINDGKPEEALKLFKQEHPLPGVCGRVCHHPCEAACTRSELEGALSIQHLHRYLADLDMAADEPYVPEKKADRTEQVAIIGSGPAGLSCAYFLAIEGYRVTVFEKYPVLGGMLRVGIPSYRLPREVIDAEIDVIRRLGVEFRTGVEIGTDVTIGRLRQQGYNAFFLGIGSHECKALGIDGEELSGVYPGVDFLRDVNLGKTVSLGDRVAVIGGGNVAMDAVRTALRTGSNHPFVIYRRSEAEMPASEEEIAECRAEGIEIRTLIQPVRVVSEDGKVSGIECIEMVLGEPDQSGRRRPEPVEGSQFVIEIDALVPAIGQESDWACLTDECACTLSDWGTMAVDPVTFQSQDPDIFAGGDAVSGPATVVEAVAAGKEAAVSIDRFIRKEALADGRGRQWEAVQDVPVETVARAERAQMPVRPAMDRKADFKEVQLGFSADTAAVEAKRCLACGVCSECYRCVSACLAQAVAHDQRAEERKVDIGSVVLCPGCEPYDPSPLSSFYLYGKNPNVVTSLEFERILSASGPTMGHMKRPGDGAEPEKIAWIQCVGSRDVNRTGNGYCSSVCCMYAIKDSMIAKEHAAGKLDCAIFNMDVRTFGKEYEKYYRRAKDKAGVRFIRARIHTIDEVGDKRDLRIRYADGDGAIVEETFDLVVLSVGLRIPESVRQTAARIGVKTGGYGFAESPELSPVETSRPGVYACGVFQAPKDIPSSVTEASAAACLAGSRLAEARNTRTKLLTLPEEIDVAGAKPRLGVFVCNCGINIAGTVDVPAVVDYARSLPGVVWAGENLFTCSEDSQQQMRKTIAEEGINRVVVAACTPKTHEPIFMDTLQACGLNKYLFEMANIRNQDSWVHANSPALATEKAKDLVRMAAARAAALSPLQEKQIPVDKRALVIGGGTAGMTAALGLADQGFEVFLAEKERQLGGMARRLTRTIGGTDIGAFLSDLIDRVSTHEKIQVLVESLIVGFSGFKGNFTTELLVGPGMYERKISHGAVVLATGAVEYRPAEYGYGESDRVVTQVELSAQLEKMGADGLNRVVMIQCVGSRNEKNPNCSRVCCQAAVKNALHIKAIRPECDVFVLYRDMRTDGLMEDYYREARQKGVLFFRYEPERPPETQARADGVTTRFVDPVLGRTLEVEADLLVLSAGMVAEDTEELASIVKLARTEEGHFMEAHVKLRPVDMATEGIFVCGTAHSPKLLHEAVAQAQAAAARAVTFLSQDHLTLSAVTARVDAERCAACLICVRSCPFSVPRINDEGFSEIDEALCHGCGVCAAECPAKAIELNWYEDDQILCKVDALLEGIR